MSASGLTVTSLGARELVLTRTFAAPRPLLFQALTRPALLKRWYGAQGWNLVECDIDLRAGGSWRYVSRGPTGETMTQYGVYLEVDAPRRMVYSERFGEQSFPGESLISAVLEEHGDRTTLRSTVRFPSPEVRALVLSRPMERGLGEGYRRLDRVLALERASGCRPAAASAAEPGSDVDARGST